MRPYYEHAGITIYHGDCREIAPSIERACVVTDPPYGLHKSAWSGQWKMSSESKKRIGRSRLWERPSWDVRVEQAVLDSIVNDSHRAIVWGGNYYQFPPRGSWLVWTKESDMTQAQAEFAWTNLDVPSRVFRLSPLGVFGNGGRNGEFKEHPTQKPVALMSWCLGFIPDGTILDPFMGSGTTLVAAKNLGRKAIGIEIEERYCEIAAKRLAQEQLPLDTAGRESRQSNEVGK